MRSRVTAWTFSVLCLSAVSTASSAPSAAQIQGWAKQLTSDRFSVREQATEQLIAAAPQSVAAVARLLKDERDGELRLRATLIVKRWLRSGDAATLEALASAGKEVARIQNEQQSVAIKWLEERGYRVTRDADGHIAINAQDAQATDFGDRELIRKLQDLVTPTRLSFYGTSPTAADLAHLKQVRTLTELSIELAHVSDAGLARLKDVTSLKKLSIDIKKITEPRAKLLGDLTFLNELSLRLTLGGPVGAELGLLKEVKSLAELSFVLDEVSDAGLAQLKELGSLKKLSFYGAKISAADLAYLKDLKSLTELSFDMEAIKGASLLQLKDLKSLRKLSFFGGTTRFGFWVSMSDGDLIYLKKFKSLSHLSFSDTLVTEKGVEALRVAMPKCKIERTESEVEDADDALSSL